jgi:hypothetical protein
LYYNLAKEISIKDVLLCCPPLPGLGAGRQGGKVMAILVNATDTNYQFNKGDKIYLKQGWFYHKVI